MVKTIQIISKSLFSKVNYSFKSHGHMENIFFGWVELMFVLFLHSISPFCSPASVHSNKAWGDWIFTSHSSEYINQFTLSKVYRNHM